MKKVNIITSILIIGYNRPEKIKQLLNILLKINTPYINIKIDGPKNKSDCIKIDEIKKIVNNFKIKKKKTKKIKIKYERKNLGLKNNIISGINWVFKSYEQCIILEDDIIPNNSFFGFCNKMLKLYNHDQNVMHISGTCFLPNNHQKDNYFFSKMPEVHGWATWRHKWNKIINKFNLDEIILNDTIDKYYQNKLISKWFLEYLYREVNSPPKKGIWSPWWQLSIIMSNAVSINPMKNLVKHDGYLIEDNATHPNFEAVKKNFFKKKEINIKKLSKKKISYIKKFDNYHYNLIKLTDPHFKKINIIKWNIKIYLRIFSLILKKNYFNLLKKISTY
jgi:hypothetical protein